MNACTETLCTFKVQFKEVLLVKGNDLTSFLYSTQHYTIAYTGTFNNAH